MSAPPRRLRPLRSPAAPSSPRSVLLVLLAANFVYSLMQSLVVPALTTFQREFSASATTTAWLFTIFLLASSLSAPILGRLGDLFGREKVVMLSITFLAAGCALAALAPSIQVLIAARALQGFAGALMPVSFGIIRDALPAHRVAGGIAAIASVLSVGAAVGIVLAGPLLQHLGYRALFWLPLSFVVPIALLVWNVIPTSPRSGDGHVDVAGAVLLAGWLVCILLGISQTPTWGWTNGRTIALFGAGLALMGRWLWTERRTPAPLIDLALLRHPAVWRSNTITFLYGVSMFAAFAFVPQFVQVPSSTGYGLGMTAAEAGLTILPWCLTSAASGMVTGHLIRRFGNPATIVAATAVCSFACLQLALVHGSRLSVYVASAVLGAGIGVAAAAVPNVIVESVGAGDVGAMAGMNANIRSISGALGAQVFAAILASATVSGTAPGEQGYRVGFLLLAGTSACAALVAATMRSHHRTSARVDRLARDLTAGG